MHACPAGQSSAPRSVAPATSGRTRPSTAPQLRTGTLALSVVIPAHNEAQVLGQALAGLLAQDFDGELDIVVVANGCTDNTAAVARRYLSAAAARGFALRVVELDRASKPRALNTGDEVRKHGTTMYLDADVVVSEHAVQSVCCTLAESNEVALVSPQLRIAPSSSVISRAYGRVWSNLPYMQRRVLGVGCFALSQDGRERWSDWPELLADDRFARLHFRRHEQRVVEDATYSWPLPEGLGELTRVRARWLQGNAELAAHYPTLAARDHGRYEGLLRFVLLHPEFWRDIFIFLVIYLLAWLHMHQALRRNERSWERATRARVLQGHRPDR